MRDIPKPYLTQAPEVLEIQHDESLASPAATFQVAVQNAVEQADASTTFFVNITPSGLSGGALKALEQSQGYIQEWQAYATSLVETQVQRKVDSRELPSDTHGQFARSSYRSKVYDWLFRQATWFAKTYDRNVDKHIQAPKYNFHMELLKSVAEGLPAQPSLYMQLEAVLQRIKDTIVASSQSKGSNVQFFVMFTYFQYDSMIESVRTNIRVITTQSTQQTTQFVLSKQHYSLVDMHFLFVQYDADFNERIWTTIRGKIDQEQIAKGKDLSNSRTINIEL